jgi:hypothetical protein
MFFGRRRLSSQLRKLIDKLEQDNKDEEENVRIEIEEIKFDYIRDNGDPTSLKPLEQSMASYYRPTK